MTDNPITTEDRDLSPSDVQALSNRDEVASFFARLGYNTDARIEQTPAAMGITAASLQRQVGHIERLAVQDEGAEPLEVYLVELTSVTVAATQGIARALRNRAGNYLLVLTDDYERLDFVLIERALRPAPDAAMATRQVSVRPRILTVNRRHITRNSVALRVLRRLSCTETDADAQYEKLLSAYTVAEWSEPLFNNRALFSDYYLNERLPERSEWLERPEETYRRLRELVAAARERLGGKPAAHTIRQLVEPAFEALGFTWAVADTDNNGVGPHYRLYRRGTTEEPLALCLAYGWNRNLDGRDETRDEQNSDENPGARVVNLLGSGEAQWAIVTNGKLWRLYSAKAHSRYTNYYEVDLEETLAMSDPNRAFRYFWLFFRAEAFKPRDVARSGGTQTLSLLDELLEESVDYAKGLGERLKDRVFEEVFPHFAAGFIEYLRSKPPLAGAYQGALLPVAQQLALKQEPNEEFRQQVFRGTLTFLYRLLFLLYAESRDLLPAREARGYWEHSLTRLKEEIAERAGDILDDAPARLNKGYSRNSTALYDRLLNLFSILDHGSDEFNVPHYDGGLFMMNLDSEEGTAEAENARFLADYKIPDQQLALGLDLLARDLDPKRQSLVFIDYKSLGVRQLGSIYEGLLEFKIRIAPERMAVVQGKKTEEVIPYREATEQNRRILKKGRGREAEERAFEPGQVYLENDKRERKATGSYYTPDHIVTYIVEHAVSPVLAEKLETLRPVFREAQQAYRRKLEAARAFQKQGLTPDNPAKVAHSYRHLVDSLFDLRVLDPAMGSGHFLVEAVDFICDRIIGQRDGFLQAFPWNPVTAYLAETRAAILSEMERQGVSIDAARLTDINLLKRHVLKRCVYGVDLNPMAVELAKVSLWLDCFTLGAPLSFLDHHLKCGNSLIGTTVQEVESELTQHTKGHVGDLFGGPFQGLLSATALIEELRRIPDATAGEAERSRELFRDFEKRQQPYKRALDIWISRHFGNSRAEEYLRGVGQELAEELRTGGSRLSPEYRQVIDRARSISNEKRFFHWDLEFPEAYVDLATGSWKTLDGQGFHAVVGNPPYDVLSTEELGHDVSLDIAYFKSAPCYAQAIRGKTNLYKLFVCRTLHLSNRRGTVSMIVPMAILGDDQAREVRRLLLQRGLSSVESFPQKDDPQRRVFPEAKLATAIFVTGIEGTDKDLVLRTHPGARLITSSDSLRLRVRELEAFDPLNFAIPSCLERDWELAKAILHNCTQRLGDIAAHRQGEVNETTCKKYLSPAAKGQPVLRGAAICMYVVRPASQGLSLELDVEEFLQMRGQRANSKVWDHQCKRVGFQRSAPQNNFRRLIAAPIPAGHFCFDTVSYVAKGAARLDLDLLLALLNSRILEWYFRLGSTNSKVNEYQFNSMPVPSIDEPGAVNSSSIAFSRTSKWASIRDELVAQCEPGRISQPVAQAVTTMTKTIQDIESKRVLKNRSERSRLAPESQEIQDVIDAVLFRCYGLSEDAAAYIDQRLKEML